MKIAIICREGRISSVFDVSDTICLIEIDDRKEQRRWNITFLNHDPFDRAKEVSYIGAKVLICGAVSRVLQMVLVGAGIEVIGFFCGELKNVLDAFIRGQLMNSRFSMPGCFGQRQRLHLWQRRGKC